MGVAFPTPQPPVRVFTLENYCSCFSWYLSQNSRVELRGKNPYFNGKFLLRPAFTYHCQFVSQLTSAYHCCSNGSGRLGILYTCIFKNEVICEKCSIQFTPAFVLLSILFIFHT